MLCPFLILINTTTHKIRYRRKSSMPRYTILDAPSNLGLRPTGVETLPIALKSAGLISKLNASYAGRVAPLPYAHERDAQTLLRNGETIRLYSIQLAEEVAKLVQDDQFPIVLGGDCSILIGAMLGLRRIGHYGLFFLDGHADFYQPEAELHGEVASMELAIVSGHGPDLLTNIDGLKPLVKEQDIVAFGFRDAEQAALEGSQDIRATVIHPYNLMQTRSPDVATTAKHTLQKLEKAQLHGFWIHLDADVLNDQMMPAVDYRMPDGFTFEELSEVLKILIQSKQAVGMTITIFNPVLDEEGAIAHNFVECVVAGLQD